MRIIIISAIVLIVAGLIYYLYRLNKTEPVSNVMVADTGQFPVNPKRGDRFLLNGIMYEYGINGRNSWFEVIPFPDNPNMGDRFEWRGAIYEFGRGGRNNWTRVG